MKKTTVKSFLLFLLIAGVVALSGQTVTDTGAAKENLPSFPVLLNGKTLFFIHADYGPFTAEERAMIVSEKLEKILADENASETELRYERKKEETRFYYRDQFVLAITPLDAKLNGKNRHVLEKEYLEILQSQIKTREFDVRRFLYGLLYSFIATVLLGIMWKFVNILSQKWSGILENLRSRIPGLKLQKLEILSPTQITDLLQALSRLGRIFILAGMVYLYLPFIFSFFPWTRNLAETIFHYTLTPLKNIGSAFIGFIPDLFVIAVIVVVTRYLIAVTHLVFTEIGKGTVRFSGFYPDWAEPTYEIIRFLMIAFSAVVIFPYIPGSNSPAFQGVSIFFGVLFSLGSTSAISNIIAGVVLTYMRPFKVGDRVQISDTTGDVVEKTLLVTRIRTIKNVDVTIPNSNILSAHMVNYSSSAQSPGLILNTTVTIGYDVDWRLVHRLLVDAATSVEDIEKDTPPFVLQTSLDDWYVSYQLNAYTEKSNSMALTYSRLHEAIQDRFHSAGVEIMSPHFMGVRDGNKANIPDTYNQIQNPTSSLRRGNTSGKQAAKKKKKN